MNEEELLRRAQEMTTAGVPPALIAQYLSEHRKPVSPGARFAKASTPALTDTGERIYPEAPRTGTEAAPDETAAQRFAGAAATAANAFDPFTDELAGAIRAPFTKRPGESLGAAYRRERDLQRNFVKEFAQEHATRAKLATATGLGAGIAATVGLPRTAAATPLVKPSLLAQSATAAKAAAPVAATYGFGAAEGSPTDQVKQAVESAVLGAGTAGAIPVLGAGATKVGELTGLNRLASAIALRARKIPGLGRVLGRSPEAEAEKSLAKIAANEGTDLNAATARAQADRAPGIVRPDMKLDVSVPRGGQIKEVSDPGAPTRRFTFHDATGAERGDLTVYLGPDGKAVGQSVTVDPAWQNRGVGRALYQTAQNAGLDVASKVGKATGLTPAGKAFTDHIAPELLMPDATGALPVAYTGADAQGIVQRAIRNNRTLEQTARAGLARIRTTMRAIGRTFDTITGSEAGAEPIRMTVPGADGLLEPATPKVARVIRNASALIPKDRLVTTGGKFSGTVGEALDKGLPLPKNMQDFVASIDLSTPVGQATLAQARKAHVDINAPKRLVPTMELFHKMRQEIDARLAQKFDPVLGDLRAKLTQAMSDQSPDFAQASQAYEQTSSRLRASEHATGARWEKRANLGHGQYVFGGSAPRVDEATHLGTRAVGSVAVGSPKIAGVNFLADFLRRNAQGLTKLSEQAMARRLLQYGPDGLAMLARAGQRQAFGPAQLLERARRSGIGVGFGAGLLSPQDQP